MPPWIDPMEQHRSTRYRPCGSSGWSFRSVMYSSSIESGSVTSSSSVSPLLGLRSSGCRLRWVIVVVTLLTVLSTAEAVCDPGWWWNLEREACVPCTVCSEQKLVLRPCQEYMDTVCGTIGDLDMDLAQLSRTEARHEQRHSKEDRRKDGHDGHHQQHGQQHHPAQHSQVSGPRKHENTEEILWDWQAASLLLAIIGCLMFFFAAALIALNQTRQWRRIEKHFDADMEALSAQLMNHLSSMQQLEDGSIFLDDVIGVGGGADHRRFRSGGGAGGGGGGSGSTSALLGGHHHHHHHHPIEVRCVYLDQLLDNKNCIQSQGPGNLYIEETNNADRGPAAAPCSHGTGSPQNRSRMY